MAVLKLDPVEFGQQALVDDPEGLSPSAKPQWGEKFSRRTATPPAAVTHGRFYQPRTASNSPSAMDETCRPTIGSPKFLLTSAMMCGSR